MRRTHFSALAAAALLSLSLLSGYGAGAGQGSQSQESGGLLAQIQVQGAQVPSMATTMRATSWWATTWRWPTPSRTSWA